MKITDKIDFIILMGLFASFFLDLLSTDDFCLDFRLVFIALCKLGEF